MDVSRASRPKRRGRVSRRKSRRLFSRTAGNRRSENVIINPMRGGIRL